MSSTWPTRAPSFTPSRNRFPPWHSRQCLLIDGGAARGERSVDRVRIRRRRQRPDPVADALDRRVIDRHRRHARAERRAQVALVDRVVVAVPVQVHALARRLIPERRIVRRADQLGRRQLVEVPVELNRLVGIERVDAAAAPARHDDRTESARCGCADRASAPSADRSARRACSSRSNSGRARPSSANRPRHVLRRHPVVERAVEHELHERLRDRAAAPACRERCAARAVGESRTVLVWHSAQLKPTWSMPSRRRRDTPIGRSCPGSMIKPNDA